MSEQKRLDEALNKASRAHAAGDFNSAARFYRKALSLSGGHIEVVRWLGVCLCQAGAHTEGRAFLLQALSARSSFGTGQLEQIRNDLAVSYLATGQACEALKIVRSYPPITDTSKTLLATLLHENGELLKARDVYESVPTTYRDGNFSKNYSNLLIELADFRAAIEAIGACPTFVEFRANLLVSGLRSSDFPLLEELTEVTMADHSLAAPLDPFYLLHIFDDGPIVEEAAKSKFKNCSTIFNRQRRPAKCSEKIKLLFVSFDFKPHAVSYLLMPLLKNMNRDRFELFGLALNSYEETAFQDEISGLFDHFSWASHLDNRSLTSLIERLKVDIAVDLTVHTRGGRPDIFNFKNRPVVINYLGYPGSAYGGPYDYIFVDHFLVPDKSLFNGTERVIRLNCCYQPNGELSSDGSLRQYQSTAESREEFRFFCFNKPQKMTADILRIWIEILHHCRQATLTLFSDSKQSEANIRKFFQDANPSLLDRLGFVYPTDLRSHLDRHYSYDVMLDTFPYGGHTTTSDALRTGSPVITVAGSGFHTRVSGSLLYHLNMADLIAKDVPNYKQLAISLYNDKSRLDAVTRRLRDGLLSEGSPFNTANTAREFEHALEACLADSV